MSEFTVPEGYALVPLWPTPEMLLCIRREEFPADWERGKKVQMAQLRSKAETHVPFKTEDEIAAGQYVRMLEAAAKDAAIQMNRFSDHS